MFDVVARIGCVSPRAVLRVQFYTFESKPIQPPWKREMASIDAWPASDEYWQRHDKLLLDGLEAELAYNDDGGFVSLTVNILKGMKLRDHTPHRLHVTCVTGTRSMGVYCKRSRRSGTVYRHT